MKAVDEAVDRAIETKVMKVIDEAVNRAVDRAIETKVMKAVDEAVDKAVNNAMKHKVRDMIRFEIKSILKPIKERLDNIELSLAEIRSSTNRLLEWADRAEHKIAVPL